MNPDQPHTPPDRDFPHDALSSDEARVLAVLLGEASPFEREAVEELLSRRPDLRAYRDRTAALLRMLPDASRPDSAPELRLDPDRRAALLEKLRRPVAFAEEAAPQPFPRHTNVVAFFRTALSAAPKYAALLAVLLILAALVIPGVSIKKVRYAERAPRMQAPDVFATGAGGAAADHDSVAEPEMSVAAGPSEVSAMAPGRALTNEKTLFDSAPGGVGGGASGEKAKMFEHKLRSKAPAPANAALAAASEADGAGDDRRSAEAYMPASPAVGMSRDRIVSKSESADMALPAAPATAPAAFASGLSAGGLAKSAGGGTGGGEGTGVGIGKGGGKSYVSTFGARSTGRAAVGDGIVSNQVAANRSDTASDEAAASEKRAESKDAKPAEPVVQTETLTAENAWSTFSLNVSDVSFRLAGEAARRGAYPDPSGIRTEEFVNAQRFRDPAPLAQEAVSLRQEQSRHPFAHNRTLLRLSLRTAAEGRAAGSPLHLIVLLDASGSMERADRRDTVAAALNALADNLRAGDKVSVLGFSRSTRLIIDRMDGSNPAPLRELAKTGVPAEGGTNLENALNEAYAQLARQVRSGASARVLLLTDGAANLGDADPARLAAVVEANRRQGRALDCFGIGFDGYNDVMLENLSRKGDGRYAYLNNADEARSELGAKLAGALRPFANDVKVQVEFNPARVASWRLLGYEKHRLRKQDFRDNTVDAAELAAAESGTAVYSLEIKPDGAGDIGTVRVRHRVPGTQDYREREWGVPNSGAPAFADAPEGVRLAACAAFVAECYADNPNAAGTDRAELRKQVARLAASRPGDAPLATLRLLADRLAGGK